MKSIYQQSSFEDYDLITKEVQELREEFKKGHTKIHDFNESVKKVFSKYNWSRKDYDNFTTAKLNMPSPDS